MAKSIFDPPDPWGAYYNMSQEEFERHMVWHIEEMRRREAEMAKANMPRGIGDWANDGFESRIARQVQDMMREQEKHFKSTMNELRSEMRHTKQRVDHINGFYTWLIETYPETVAQYKALMDLQRATGYGETEATL